MLKVSKNLTVQWLRKAGRKFLFLYLISLLLNLTSLTAIAALSPEHFRIDTMKHKNRLHLFAQAAFEKFPEYFPNLNKNLITLYMNKHDLPKIQGLNTLHKWGYTHPQTLTDRLASHYGFSRFDPGIYSHIKTELDAIVNDLNSIEDKQKEFFFRKMRLTNEQIAELKKIELWVDITDTLIFRRTELNITCDGYGGACRFFKQNDYAGAMVSIYLENNYKKILNSAKSAANCRQILGF